MGTQTVVLTDSEVTAKITADGVIIEPNDRTRGYGVAFTLQEAISLGNLFRDLELMLNEEQIGIDAAHPLA